MGREDPPPGHPYPYHWKPTMIHPNTDGPLWTLDRFRQPGPASIDPAYNESTPGPLSIDREPDAIHPRIETALSPRSTRRHYPCLDSDGVDVEPIHPKARRARNRADRRDAKHAVRVLTLSLSA